MASDPKLRRKSPFDLSEEELELMYDPDDIILPGEQETDEETDEDEQGSSS